MNLIRKSVLLSALILVLTHSIRAQLYFPPTNTDTWEITPYENLNWCSDSVLALYDYLEDKNSKAFIVLQDGKIVLEKYFDNFGPDSFWYWASAGKSLRSVLVGIAQREGALSLSDKVSDHLDTGWTNCCLDKEQLIQVKHQLSMSTGLDDKVNDPYCTDDSCLHYLMDAGSRWAYHNAPYTLLRDVLESATGETMNQFSYSRVAKLIGMNGLWVNVGYNQFYFSNARSMARFGLLALNRGDWGVQPVLSDTNYFEAMINSSQSINPSYGFLWWLNGKNSYMLPGSQTKFPGSLIPNAPDDMYAALGANDQKIYVVPSKKMVVIRIGNAAGTSANATSSFDNDLWYKIEHLTCLSGSSISQEKIPFKIQPNPATNLVRIQTRENIDKCQIYSSTGVKLATYTNQAVFDISNLVPGIYVMDIEVGPHTYHLRLIKE
jgi:CubicO group peptidase (beta-lactamase class C family)